ncbi:L,D-transpeptidase family protein [Pacificoceanicola onchidii]|uniref:L,D-transpeptidase family protein n=1 Tax=Pacificoceanicola onchidii TaxID=2562685 RepID=UPI0010A5DA7A|nr:L,D-transpeptidase family protein [Pacificoceanicola onchidii]
MKRVSVSFGRTSAIALLAAGVIFATAPKGQAQDSFSFQVTAYKQAVAERIGEDESVAEFYRLRGFEPIWTGPSDEDRARRAALFDALSMAADHGLPGRRYNADALMARMATVQTGRDRGQLELDLTNLYLRFAHDISTGALDGTKVSPGIKRKPPRHASGNLLARLVKEDPAFVMRDLAPRTAEYTRLMRAKLRMEHRIAHGGWGPVVPTQSLKPGSSGPAVIALRNRLTAMGYLRSSLSGTYDSAMEAAVSQFQEDHGIEVDGVAGATTMREVNTTPEARLKSIIVAMERERWLNRPEGRGKRHVLVNLVDYHAQVIDDDKLTYETRSVIGHQAMDRRTPEFSDVMTHMVINPSWYVPRSIIVKEYLPLLRNNPGAVGHLQIVDARGRVVGRGRSFAGYSARSFPFNMRQPPGPRNALGSVKFMFPNKYNIYLHDTPSQHLFSRTVRTFSHGCIRLDDPHDFAYALLGPQEDDPKGTFHRILNTGAETRVNLEQEVPVHLIYRTAFTQAKGQMNYRPDVYNRDQLLWRALANEGVALRTGRS